MSEISKYKNKKITTINATGNQQDSITGSDLDVLMRIPEVSVADREYLDFLLENTYEDNLALQIKEEKSF